MTIYVSQNPHVLNGLTLDGIISAFTTPHVGNWLPLTWLSFMLDCRLFDANPGWMHLVNLLMHILNTLLLFAVLKKMTELRTLWPSAFVAAAFALHPMHVESVAWITERKDVLSTLFFMLTLTTYVCYVKNRSLSSYLLTILLFVFGLLAKPMLVTLPFVLLLLDYWPLNRFAREPRRSQDERTDMQATWHLDGRTIGMANNRKNSFLCSCGCLRRNYVYSSKGQRGGAGYQYHFFTKQICQCFFVVCQIHWQNVLAAEPGGILSA